MKLKSLYTSLFIVIYLSVNAQTNTIKINPNIVIPSDSLKSKALLFSVNAFLSSAQENNKNKWILTTESIETQILIDEIQYIQKSKEFENDSFFKAYITNIIPLEKNNYKVKISYIGVNKKSVILRANFELIAHKINDVFLISSPLKRNTQHWKTKKIQNHIFHYPYTLDENMIQKFVYNVVLYDEKLKNNIGEKHYYMCKNETNPLELFGVEYKSDYNGDELITRYTSQLNRKSLWVANEFRIYNYNFHDLWHNRLSQLISRSEVHRRVDCHIATLYGGIWGLSWDELFPLFKEKFVVGTNVDWLEHKKNKSHFLTTEHKRKNYTDDFIGALIVRKIEKEKGFDGVWELLMTKRTKKEEEYFTTLEKLTGITKKNYNKEVSKLIEKEIANR